MQKSFFLLLGQFLVTKVMLANAQINPSQIPQVCVQECQSLLDLASTCDAEYSSNPSDYASSACVCTGIQGINYSSCKTCLQTNAPGIGEAVEHIPAYCTDLANSCKYECDFPTCDSSNVACQCAEPYLQNIYDCGACNTAHRNNNATTMTDYNALRESCVNQSYTATPSQTELPPSPSGTVSYIAGNTDAGTSHAPGDGSTTATGMRPGTTLSTGGNVGNGTNSDTGAPSTQTGGAKSTTGAKYDYIWGLVAVAVFGRLVV